MILMPRAESREPARSFTLTELLAAMAIIAIIAGVTAISVRTIARDAKLSSASNTVAAALDTARGIAIRDNRLTVVVFRARPDGTNRQYIEIVTAQWTGESPGLFYLDFGGGNVPLRVIDRFVPVPGIAARRLPTGIKVSGPNFSGNDDDLWLTQTHLPAFDEDDGAGEAPGQIIGVMFAGNGTVVTRNSAMDSHGLFVDFNRDGFQSINGDWGFDFDDPFPQPEVNFNDFLTYFNQAGEHSEPLVTPVPFLAVFDDDRCRDEYDVSAWTNSFTRTENYTEYINGNADRIHFNRYTGVVMR